MNFKCFKCKIESENNRCLMNYISKISFKLLILSSYVCLVLWKNRDFCLKKILSFGKQNFIHIHNHPCKSLAITFICGAYYVSVIQIHIFLIQNPLDANAKVCLWWFNSWSWYITINLIVPLSNSLILSK